MALVSEMTSVAVGVLGAVPAQDAEPGSASSMPGLGSFIVFVFLAIALYLLLRNLNARLRRMSYREKERQAAEAAETDEAPEVTNEPGKSDEEPQG